MVFGKSKLELNVGIFVFGGLAILTAFVLLIGNIKTWTSGYRVDFVFNFVNGVKIGAPVRFAGVDVGEVREIKCVYSPEDGITRVEVNCWIKKDTRMPSDSTVWVNTLGLLGEKYIEVMPGKNYSEILTHGGKLQGVDPVPMHEVTELAKKIATDVDENLSKIKNKQGTMGMLLSDDSLYKALLAFIEDLQKNPWKLFYKPKGVK